MLGLITTLALSGCGASELPQPWILDRLRILAVQAEPAEPQPGEAISFSALTYAPEGEVLAATLWFACLPSEASDFGCAMDETGIIGMEPGWAPTWTAPADALDGLDARGQAEGVSALVNLAAILEGSPLLEEGGDTGGFDLEGSELAFKRLPISLSSTPNHNPILTAIVVDGHILRPGAPLLTIPKAKHQLSPILAAGSLETYTYLATDGTEESRTEEPYINWYIDGGTLGQPFGLYPLLDLEWTAPSTPGSGIIVGVIRDRRGGMAWTKIPYRVQAP